MLAVPVGLLIAAILVVNNVRDIDTDRRAGKRTLAVRLGRERTRIALRRDGRGRVRTRGCRGSPARSRRGCSSRRRRRRSRSRSCDVVRTHTDGPSLNGALAARAKLALVFCLLLCAGVLAS